MMMNSVRRWGVGIGLLMACQVVLAQELVFTAPPREKPEAGQKLYGPIVEHLNKLLGRKVVYEHPGNWLNYQRNMREDKYDIVFDGPHFISWRMEHLQHEVVVKLPGHLQFFLVTNKNETEVTKTTDLVGKRICGISPPNLSSLSIIAAYQNPVRQPVIKGVKGGMPAVLKTYMGGKKDCRASILRSAFFKKKVKKEVQDQLKIIYKTPKLPNQGISISKRLSPRDKTLIQQSFMHGDGIKATANLRRRFAGKSKSMVRATTEEFTGHNLLLEGVIFGW